VARRVLCAILQLIIIGEIRNLKQKAKNDNVKFKISPLLFYFFVLNFLIYNMDIQKLTTTAQKMVAKGKGILAADESTGTIEKRLSKINVPSTEENRRAYRGMLFTTPSLGEYISGVIMFDETIRQGADDGTLFVDVLKNAGILSGIKVDKGTEAMEGSPDEKLTKGLDGLTERMKEYASLGAEFAKWRAVITIGDDLPTEENLKSNTKTLAEYARVCQEAGVVPIVEPEVLMDGSHSMARCEEVSERVLEAQFDALKKAGVMLEGMILKTNMIVPGKESGEDASSEQIAEATLRVFKKTLPDNLAGEAFLSGGQSEVEATENLNEINKRGPFPWVLTFSYGRALQESALKTWNGKKENIPQAQKTLLRRAKMNSLATKGEYSADIETLMG